MHFAHTLRIHSLRSKRCPRKKLCKPRTRTSAKARRRRRRPASSFARKFTTFAKGSTAHATPSKRSPSDFRRRGDRVCVCPPPEKVRARKPAKSRPGHHPREKSAAEDIEQSRPGRQRCG